MLYTILKMALGFSRLLHLIRVIDTDAFQRLKTRSFADEKLKG